jgi:UDP-N-acetylmuramyl pentapeptide phosphotransferase/UDP-N-acetylglucosamine-1-phosphate transferase
MTAAVRRPGDRRLGFLGRTALVGLGALAAAGALRAAGRRPELDRTNFAGRTVNLAGGPALAVGATLASAAGAGSVPMAGAALVAGGVSGAVGLYDDIVGARPDQKAYKGFRGHVAALRDGKVTSGLVKIAGVGAAGLVASALVERDPRQRPRGRFGRLVNVALGAGVVAGSANLLNLLDLRPGRALKAGTLLGAPMVAGPVGAALALLPDDLDEQIMLGDTGANAFGALLGVGVLGRTGIPGRAALLAVIAGLTAASEKVSFSQVIATTPGLRELDALGRRTDHDVAPNTPG